MNKFISENVLEGNLNFSKLNNPIKWG